MSIHILILNHNGRGLLAECLPSVVRAAERSRYPSDVAVIDNDSTDDSVLWLEEHFPEVRVIRRPNRGLCSFNDMVVELDGVALLLNNDIRLASDAIDPLVEPLGSDPDCFMTAPLCWRFDGRTYEGFKTAVRWRWGLVQATAIFEGHEAGIRQPGPTASAGAALAVHCRKFVQLGGFDPLYLPGRLEDLDFAFRGYMAGYHARYVPKSVAYHRGMATFGAVFGHDGCDRLALRNTLLFQWKNLRRPSHVVRHLAALPLRLLQDVCRAPVTRRGQRWAFVRALFGALCRAGRLRRDPYLANVNLARERAFFRKFDPQQVIDNETAATPRHDRPARMPELSLSR